VTPVIEAIELTKRYGSSRGVDELTFEVAKGEVFGYLGPNGAGKTTTIRTFLDFIRPTSGTVRVFGLDPRSDGVQVHARVGYLPGELALYPRLRGERYLRTFASLRDGSGWPFAEQLADRLQLDLDRPIKELSHGNKQKVGLVQAFMHRPDLLVLDEPTGGLDPLVQQVFYELVREAAGEGRTVFLSSHILSEVQHVAARVAVVREGRLVLVDEIEALRERAPARVEATFAQAPPDDAFAGLDGVTELERRGTTVVFSLRGPADPLVKALARHTVLGLDSHEADLEDVFVELYRGGGPDAG
jgi:ABC-2 type transport system ATP-binding protein